MNKRPGRIKLNPEEHGMEHIDACPNCKCTEKWIEIWRFDDIHVLSFVEEYIIGCANCEWIKEHWSYGHFLKLEWKDTIPEEFYAKE